VTELQMLAIAYFFFLALIGTEIAVSLYKGDGGYRIGEAVVNVGHGVVYQVVDFLTKGLVALPFVALAGFVSWDLLPTNVWWGWLLGLIAYDFCSYWAHRHHHEIGVLWAIHGTHHAAEDFNLAAALRQPAFQKAFSWLWRLPLVFVLSGEMLIGLIVFDFLYQFIQHTRYVPKLGPVEWVMNTPSHHRVHHGTQEKYLDKNYGGILIIWDRLFGTFKEEEEEPVYGLTKPLGSLNAVWGNFAMHAELVDAAKTVTGWRKVAVWFAGPGRLADLAPDHDYAVPPVFEDAAAPIGIRIYVVATSLCLVPVLGWMVMVGDSWQWAARIAVSAFVVASVVLAGALLERKSWALPAEMSRIGLGTVAACVILATPWPAAVGLVLAIWFASMHAEIHQSRLALD